MIYFVSILDGEFIKIGYTNSSVEKRISSLQTGNPYEIKVLFTVEGTLYQEKELHRELMKLFSRLEVFNNPVNEWYPGANPIIKSFMCNSRNLGINYAIQNIKSIFNWDQDVSANEVFTVRHLERALRNRGMSKNQAKRLISQKKFELMCVYNDYN